MNVFGHVGINLDYYSLFILMCPNHRYMDVLLVNVLGIAFWFAYLHLNIVINLECINHFERCKWQFIQSLHNTNRFL